MTTGSLIRYKLIQLPILPIVTHHEWLGESVSRGLPSSNFFPYKSSYHFQYLNCCQILYSNATDLKFGSSTYFFLLYSFLEFTKCPDLNLGVVGHVTRSCKGPILCSRGANSKIKITSIWKYCNTLPGNESNTFPLYL